MSDIQHLLARCRDLGAELTPTPHGTLKIKAPAPLPESIQAELKVRKAEILALLSQELSSQQDQTALLQCSFCGISEGVWRVNAGTCWERLTCEVCQGKIAMPKAHLCDPCFPPSAPCKGQPPRRHWLCSVCGGKVTIESIEEVEGRKLTFWRCERKCSAGVTPASVAEPPVMVPLTRQ